MRFFLGGLVVFLLLSCASQKYNQFADETQDGLNVYLWRTTNSIWVNSFENRVKELVDRGADVDYIAEYASSKTTPFLNAAGCYDVLRQRQRHYTEEQIEAIEWEAVKIVKYLAKNGANIHAVSTSRKLNALHLAAVGGREKMMPVLVEMGLDINSRDSSEHGLTVLLHALGAGDLATVKAVVEAGADINLCALDGNSPLDYAIAFSRSKEHQGWMHYKEHGACAEYMKSLGAQHGKNDFTGNLLLSEANIQRYDRELEERRLFEEAAAAPVPDVDHKVTHGTMTDQDGNTYKTITIGTQTWMAENLRTTTYTDGTSIHKVTDSYVWMDAVVGAYCGYKNSNDADTIATYGYLYNWFAVDSGKLAPEGWHIPTYEEWMVLIDALGGMPIAGGELKESGTAHWEHPNERARNTIGFTALPGGYCAGIYFYSMGSKGYWWSSTEDWPDVKALVMDMNNGSVVMFKGDNKSYYGLSVRCVKD